MILAVDNGEDSATVLRTAQERGYRFPVLVDRRGDVLRAYGVTWRPQSVLVGPDGTVLAVSIGARSAENWRQVLARHQVAS